MITFETTTRRTGRLVPTVYGRTMGIDELPPAIGGAAAAHVFPWQQPLPRVMRGVVGGAVTQRLCTLAA